MRRQARNAIRALALPTAAVLAVAIFVSGQLDLALRVYVLVVCGTTLVLGVLALRDGAPAEHPLRNPSRSASGGRRPPPSSLARLEHDTAIGVAGAFDLHFRFAPHLREIAAGLLEHRRRISLQAHPEDARAVLGESTWELVRPDRPAPEDRLGRGLATRELDAVVESLEAV